MTIFGGGGLHAIPQSARPDALAASRCIIKQPKPLRAAATPRADKHRPEAAVCERSYSDTDPIFDALVAKPDKRRHGLTPYVTVRHQGRHANQRQIFNSGPHEVETYCFSDQHSMLLCMIAPLRVSLDAPPPSTQNPPRPCFSHGVQRLLEARRDGPVFCQFWQRVAAAHLTFRADGVRRRVSGVRPWVLNGFLGTCQNPHGGFGVFRPPPPKRPRVKPNQLGRFRREAVAADCRPRTSRLGGTDNPAFTR
jgi:hypothetical protein